MNDRAAFVVRRAQPVAGPGIEKVQAVEPPPDAKLETQLRKEKHEKEERQKDEERKHEVALSFNASVQQKRLIDLDTVMLMLDMVKAHERDHLKSLIHILNQLSATSRQRVLTIINRIFA